MDYRALAKIAEKELQPSIGRHGFVDVTKACLFVRRTAEVFHVVAFDKSRHGERVRVHVYPWVPEFAFRPEAKGDLTLAQALSLTWSKYETLGVYTIGSTRWWSIEDEAQATASLASMVAPFVRGVLPWFAQFNQRKDLLKALVPDTPQSIRDALVASAAIQLPKKLQELPIFTTQDSGAGLAS